MQAQLTVDTNYIQPQSSFRDLERAFQLVLVAKGTCHSTRLHITQQVIIVIRVSFPQLISKIPKNIRIVQLTVTNTRNLELSRRARTEKPIDDTAPT